MAGERGPLAVHCAWREWEDDEAILWVREVLGETESTRATQMPAGMVRGAVLARFQGSCGCGCRGLC